MAKPLRIALTKGRLEKDTVGLLERLGYDCTAVREKGRRLILPIPDGNMEVVEDVVPISARLIANTVSLKLRQTEIEALIQKIEEAL